MREHLRGLVSAEAFTIWFQETTGSVEEKNGAYVLRIVVPTKFHCEHIREQFSSHVEAFWRRLAPDGTVIFAVQERQASEPEQHGRALEKLPAQVLQFPVFPNATRPVSNAMARSALFSCVQGKDRQMLKEELLAAQDGMEMRFTGEQLNQDDHDLLMQLIFMGRHKPFGEYTTVPAYAVLKALGRKTGGSHYRQLRADITRLMACVVSVRDTKNKVEYLGHVIEEAAQDETSRHWVFKFNPKLRPLYDTNNYTLIDWEQRKKLRGKDLARWLQLYIASHAAPFPVSVAYLHDKSGSQTTELWKFRQLLKTALQDLEVNKDIEHSCIDTPTDLVHVDRGKAVTDSQRRHLTRPKATKKRQGQS